MARPVNAGRAKLPHAVGAFLCAGLLVACRGDAPAAAEKGSAPAGGTTTNASASKSASASNGPLPTSPASTTPAIGASAGGRDITIPPGDVDVHVVNGRNIFSAPVEKGPSERAPNPQHAEVRVTFWTTPDGQRLPVPQLYEGSLAELELGAGDLSMLTPGEKRRLWIPGPTGMATLDVELLEK